MRRGRWGKTPTIKISGCHSAILITKLDVPASIGVQYMRIFHPKNSSTPRRPLCDAVGVRRRRVLHAMSDNWYSLGPPHRSVLWGKQGVFLPSGTSKVTCVRPWERTGWLGWQWWPCIPAMHGRWTPRPSCRTAGKPQEAVLPVNLVWLTEIHLALRRTCHQPCFLSFWFQVFFLVSFAIDNRLDNLNSLLHASSLCQGQIVLPYDSFRAWLVKMYCMVLRPTLS